MRCALRLLISCPCSLQDSDSGTCRSYGSAVTHRQRKIGCYKADVWQIQVAEVTTPEPQASVLTPAAVLTLGCVAECAGIAAPGRGHAGQRCAWLHWRGDRRSCMLLGRVRPVHGTTDSRGRPGPHHESCSHASGSPSSRGHSDLRCAERRFALPQRWCQTYIKAAHGLAIRPGRALNIAVLSRAAGRRTGWTTCHRVHCASALC